MERVNEKYGWVVFLFLGLLWVVVGIVQVFSPGELLRTDAQLITGLSWSELKASSPIATDLVRFHYGGMGLLKTSWSFLVLAITLTGYRKGEKWAWYTLWLVPALLVCNAFYNVNFLGDVNQMLEWIPVTSVSLLGLLLPYRKFFPR
jgi:cbb3-type cytochrome oxidase subunit 1